MNIRHTFYKVWFSMAALALLVMNWATCVTISALVPDPTTAQKWCYIVNHYLFHMLLKACPWIRISPPPVQDMKRLMGKGKVCLLMNHTSFFDTVLFVSTIPASVIWRYKALMKSGMFKAPLLGGICSMLGHYPVYFTSTDQNTFTVDKPKQAEVMKEMKAYVDAKGCFCIFPEGKINRNPAELCQFRKGIFNIIEEKGMSVVLLTSIGNNKAWPVGDVVGGLPAEISMKLTEVAKEGHGMSSDEIREKAREVMQADVDFLLQERNGPKSKES